MQPSLLILRTESTNQSGHILDNMQQAQPKPSFMANISHSCMQIKMSSLETTL